MKSTKKEIEKQIAKNSFLNQVLRKSPVIQIHNVHAKFSDTFTQIFQNEAHISNKIDDTSPEMKKMIKDLVSEHLSNIDRSFKYNNSGMSLLTGNSWITYTAGLSGKVDDPENLSNKDKERMYLVKFAPDSRGERMLRVEYNWEERDDGMGGVIVIRVLRIFSDIGIYYDG